MRPVAEDDLPQDGRMSGETAFVDLAEMDAEPHVDGTVGREVGGSWSGCGPNRCCAGLSWGGGVA
ncbi:hypothetical protein [Actinomadura pelletieri]|uniref:hypothetical protein n=1 Tax=Actinomadura pelletieri TaxID=111805 RepID=UPI000EB411AA|nr:hypothetical protein [Actinomadura pelletieri]